MCLVRPETQGKLYVGQTRRRSSLWQQIKYHKTMLQKWICSYERSKLLCKRKKFCKQWVFSNKIKPSKNRNHQDTSDSPIRDAYQLLRPSCTLLHNNTTIYTSYKYVTRIDLFWLSIRLGVSGAKYGIYTI